MGRHLKKERTKMKKNLSTRRYVKRLGIESKTNYEIGYLVGIPKNTEMIFTFFL